MRGLVIQKTVTFSKVRAGPETFLIVKSTLTHGVLPELGTFIEFEDADIVPGQVRTVKKFKTCADTSYVSVLCDLYEGQELQSFEIHEIGESLARFCHEKKLTYVGFTSHKGRQRFIFR